MARKPIKRSFVLSFIICAALVPDAASQKSGQGSSEPARSDSFRIAPGSMFDTSPRGHVPSDTIERTTRPAMSEPLLNAANEINEALEIIKRNHAAGKALDQDAVTGSAITSMLKSLDPHSNYYDKREFAELLGGHRSEYSGTGVFITNFGHGGSRGTYIVASAPNSAASRAGLRFGDRIISLDGKSVGGMDSYAVREMIRGERGSLVEITVERADTLGAEKLSLRRERLSQPSIPRAFMLEDKVGYIEMSSGFSYSTVTELDTAMADLKKRGAVALVIDLRGNPGGIVDQAVAVAERFLPAGAKILSQRGRFSGDDRVWISQNKKPETMPVVLLTDDTTASAAEIVAGAFQDNDRALIVGQRTFGKGLVQNVLDLPDGAGLTLTAARYYTPSGRSIQRNYTGTGLYDYYKRTERAALIEESFEAAKTLTNRTVHGGNGIAPDVAVEQENYSEERARLIDRIFLFTVDLANGRIAGQPSRAALRQRAIFEKPIVTDQMVEAFMKYLADSGENLPNEKNIDIVKADLEHYLALALFGQDAAARAMLAHDKTVTAAISSIPASAKLAKRARAVADPLQMARKSPPKR